MLNHQHHVSKTSQGKVLQAARIGMLVDVDLDFLANI